jgi:uncharacterized membrane protein YcaP (DUF421 family)
VWTLRTPLPDLIFRAAVVYAIFFIALRLFGKREIGQFTLFDLALVLLAANALQPAITGPDDSLAGGLVIVATLFVINRSVAFVRVRSPLVRRVLDFGPRVIGRDGAWLPDALDREGLDMIDVEEALREHGLAEVSDVKLATMEGDGTISIVPRDDVGSTQRRRRRYRRPRS